MKIKQSTTDGNIQVIDELHEQGGIGEPGDVGFIVAYDVDISEWVLIAHGDLLTKERLDSIMASRSIEATPKKRFQHIIFLPGLFHYKMACADALWRTWVKPKEARTDPNSLMEHVCVLRPDDTGKFGSGPGFRMMHDTIHCDLQASMLDAWTTEIRKSAGHDSLEAWAESGPSWDDIVKASEDIALTYVSTSISHSDAQDRASKDRDEVFENQALRNRDELLYVDMCHAMNAGDIGRVEASFLPWIHMFKATGKHKYASQMLKFMLNLKYRYPPGLSEIIRLNWLVNTTGKPHAFRGVDWLVELNNLYTKVIHAGGSSNRMIDHIIKESPLIELYRECHTTVENGFHLMHRTIRHQPPNMRKTLDTLGGIMSAVQPHKFLAGRKANYSVPDQIAVAMNLVMKKVTVAEWTGDEDDEGTADVAPEDLADG
ncbi:hypothetical protein C8J56DRAFT_793049 [Mycena floridula]|nr:hypothetical protein C8J56DRAFT_793049 [Mycena floridula]